MCEADVEIRRPGPEDWPGILAVLASANFEPIGGLEMPLFPLSDCFVARCDDQVIGVGGYRMLDPKTAKTTLLAVDPRYRGRAVGIALQRARQDWLRHQGVRTLHTNVDDERTAAWYARHFGYVKTGERIPKMEPFGRLDRHEWIALRLDL